MRGVLAALLAAMGAGYVLVTGWYPDVAWIHQAVWTWGYPAGLTLAALLGMAVSAWLLRRDPALAAWGVLGLAGSLLLLPLLLARAQQEQVDQEVLARLQEQRSVLRTELARQRAEREAAERERRDGRPSDRFVQYEGRLPADTLDSLRRIDAEMQEAADSQARSYMEALQQNPTRGPASWMRFRSPDELDAELQAHTELYARTRTFTRFIESFEERYTAKIEALDLKPPADRVAIAELERILQSWEQTQLTTFRQLDVRLLAEAIRALNLLRDHWGQWEFLPRENRITFQNRDAEADFLQAIRNLQAISSEMEALR